jgi:hypothetical protein
MPKQKIRALKAPPKAKPNDPESWAFGLSRWATRLWVIPYIAALAFWRDKVPDGLNNDAVEEALRGIYLVAERKFEVMTFSLGASAETLYLYIVGLVSNFLGPTSLAIQLPSWMFAVASIYLLCVAGRRLDPALPEWVCVLLGTSSIMLFHYARSGLRAITSPFFFLLFWLLFERAERNTESRVTAFAAGGVLGLSIYSYTSCRVLMIASFVYGGIRLLRNRQQRRDLLACYFQVAIGALVLSIPNLLFLFSHPQEFLFRGSYSMPQDFSLVLEGVFWSFVLPFYYPVHATSEFFHRVFEIDSVSNGLVVTGINPIHIVVAVAFAAGVVRAYRLRNQPGPLFLLVQWLTGIAVLGLAGPSLTRLLILLPVYLLLAGLAIGEGLKWRSRCRPWFAILLFLPLIGHGYRYFSEIGTSPFARFYASSAATPMGQRAEAVAGEGARVVCVVSKDANIVRYLTHLHVDQVRVAEFYFRPLDAGEIPLNEFRPEVLLVEKAPAFQNFSRQFPNSTKTTYESFEEIRLP